jgi:hypothetical protein
MTRSHGPGAKRSTRPRVERAAGPPEKLNTDLRSLLERRALSTAPVDEVAAALDLLAAHGPLPSGARIEVDLSLARGLRNTRDWLRDLRR